MTRDDLLDDLTDAQRAAVEHGDGPLLVVAGPGSGKTRVITRRIAHLIRRGVDPYSILAITFTNKAAQEMARRVEASGAPRGAWVKTFHATCAAILRRWPEPAGLVTGFSIFDTQDQKRTLRGILKRPEFEDGALKPAQVRSRISRWKTSGIRPASAVADARFHFDRMYAAAYVAYEQELAENNAVDFDDLLVRTLRMLEEDEPVRTRLQERFVHVLIDEYQDTSPVQFQLASILSEPQGNLCATGDPDQSIYAFRNADVRNILDFQTNYPDAAIVSLEENFRSVARVLRVADALIANNRDRHEKRLVPTKEDGALVRVYGAASEHDEGEAISEAILEAYARGTPYKDIAVFYRVNAQSRAIETALRSRGVPYTIVKGVEFYQRSEVKDLIAFLRVLANPQDRESLTRALTTPKRGVGAKSLARLFELARENGWNAREALTRVADLGELSKRATLGLRDVAQLLDRVERGVTGSVAELMRDLVTHLRYEEHLRKVYREDCDDRIENVQELIGSAREYDARAGAAAALPDFLHEVGLVSDADAYDPDMPRVALMTLHSAKGLEFPHVFIAGVEEGLLPHQRSADDRKAVEEERRLLFVGITRAEQHLMLSYARERMARIGGPGAGGASSFLAELPEDALDITRSSFHSPQTQTWGGRSTGGGYARGRSSRSTSSRASPSRSAGGDATRQWGAWGSESEGIDDLVDLAGIDVDPDAALHVGQRVHHPHFGEGTIRRLRGRGSRATAVVHFDGRGEKTLALDHAKLTPIT